MKNAWKSLALGALVTSMTACSGGGGSNDASPSTNRSVTIKGSFNTGGLASLKPIYGLEILPMAAADYGVYCMVIAGSGSSTSYGGPLSDTGAFNFVGSFPAGKPIGCLLTKSEEIVGFFSFKTTTNTKGGASHQKSYPLKEDSSELDFGTGLAVGAGDAIAVASVTDNGTIASSNNITDLTGSWQVVSSYVDHANGYYHPCDMEGDISAEEMAACKSSWAGIYLNMYKFTKASPAEERYGISLWENPASFSACSAEGYNGALSGGWSVDQTFNSNGSKVVTAIPTPSIAMNNLSIGSPVLLGAPYKYYGRDNGSYFETNCPIMPDDTIGPITEADVPAACKDAAKTSCGSFTLAEWQSGTTATGDALGKLVSRRKVQCVMNTLTSGGASGYNWGSVCAARLKPEIWKSYQSVETSPGSGTWVCSGPNCGWGDRNMAIDGSGCSNANCTAVAGADPLVEPAIAGLAGYWNSNPRNRHIQGEVFLAGSVASGTVAESVNENVNSYKCPIRKTFSYTFTQTGANTMDAVVENMITRGADWGNTVAGNGTEAQCLGTAGSPTWLGGEFKRGLVKIKLGFQKQ